ncbi:MAG: aromatic ring-hydroxylating dioxygenase subunit alpha [Chloroflexi bacterium]|nr:aromatic ring-hydroxylating dioxygenase subunit alpha [Chloroflexota bacterium]
MIRNQWYVVLDSKEVKDKPVGAKRLGEKLVFWRDSKQKVRCAFDRCPHRGVALSLGKVRENHLQCPFHGFEFDSNGQCVLIPAEGRSSQPPAAMRLNTYPTYEAHGFIWIWWGDKAPADLKPPNFFENIDDHFIYGSAIDPWKAHYSRVVENQLDVAHLPFVHRKTIGRGNRTLVDGPKVIWNKNKMMSTYVFNRVDDGSKARLASELQPRDGQVHLEFIMPNLWQNHISEKVRILAAFVPVDDENTLLYLRFYQKFLSVPVFGKIVAQLAMPSNLKIAREDRGVVESHTPLVSSLRGGDEKPIKADAPIIEYRRLRDALQKQNQ